MKISTFLFLIFVSAYSWACSHTDPDAPRRDRLFQRELAAEYAGTADFIYIADVKRLNANGVEAELEIVEQFKGDPVTTQTAIRKWQFDNEIGGCSSSFFFQKTNVAAGYRYIVYVKNGKMLRAGDIERDSTYISLRDEIKIIKKVISDKPQNIAPQKN